MTSEGEVTVFRHTGVGETLERRKRMIKDSRILGGPSCGEAQRVGTTFLAITGRGLGKITQVLFLNGIDTTAIN